MQEVPAHKQNPEGCHKTYQTPPNHQGSAQGTYTTSGTLRFCVSPCKRVKKQSRIEPLASKLVLVIRHEGGGRTPPCPRPRWPGKPSPEIAPFQPPPPKPGFGFSCSCSLPNCSSLNSLPSSFLGEDLPRGMTAGCTTSR